MTGSTQRMRFVVIGAGGLGGPIAYALAAAGAKAITIVDPDHVELSNLQRQVQFSGSDVGALKVEALLRELGRRGFESEKVRAMNAALCPETADAIFADADVVIDGTDNLATKFFTNDEAVARGLPVVIAGISRYAGQVLAAKPGHSGCYRCLFEGIPDGDAAPSCADAGVLGAICAVIGGEAAQHAIALARGEDAVGLTVYDDVTSSASPRRVRISCRPDCAACAALSRARRWAS